MREFISFDITHDILEWTLAIFSSDKEGILELLDGRLRALRDEIVTGWLGDLLEPKACGSLESFRKEDHIVSSCQLGSEVVYTPRLQES